MFLSLAQDKNIYPFLYMDKNIYSVTNVGGFMCLLPISAGFSSIDPLIEIYPNSHQRVASDFYEIQICDSEKRGRRIGKFN